jgi:hypothetical protein
MKTKLTLLIGAVALVTLSFTFANVDNQTAKQDVNIENSSTSSPVGGIMSDEVVK